MIESIVIENFQSLRDPVEIPLAPVTLVYGPNSAGKSALLDALNFVHAIFTEDSEKCRSLAARYAHMLESNSSQLPIKIRIRGRARLFDWNSVSCINLRNRSRFVEASDDEFYEIWEPKDSVISEGFGDVHIEWCIECWPRVQDAYDALRSLSINVNGCPALLLEVEDDESINVCLSFDPKVFGPTFTDLARQYKVKPGKDGSYYLRVDLETRPLRVIKSDVNLDRKPFFETMTVLANWLFERTAEILAPPVIVSADRGVIDDRELIVFAAENGRTGLPQSFTSLPDRELLSKEMLTGSRSSIIERMAIARLREDFGSKYSLGTLTREPIDHFVNRCLVDHLFLDVGYQVRFDVCEVLPAVGTSGAVPNKTLSDRPMRAALLLCYLTDRDGRQLTFQDVGTSVASFRCSVRCTLVSASFNNPSCICTLRCRRRWPMSRLRLPTV